MRGSMFLTGKRMSSTVVEVGKSFKITLPSEIGKVFSISDGQKLYVLASEDLLILRKIPERPSDRLDELIGELTFDKDTKKRAERWLLNQAEKAS